MKLLIAPWLCILCAAVDEPATRFLQSRAVKTQTKGTPADADRHDGLVTTATGGAQLWLSKVALNYVAQELLPQILRNLTRVPLGSYKGTYKGVEYRLWDVDLNHMGINKPSIQFRKDEGLHFCLSGIHANVTSDWSAEWYFVSLEGATSVLVADGEVCAVIALKAAHGHPKVEIDNLDVTLELGPITFTGTSIHWLMNAAAFLFESYLEDLASSTIKSNVETAVKKNLAESLKHLDLSTSLEMPENKGSISIDVSLESIKTQANYLQVDVKGLPSVNDTACPFPPQEESYRVPNAWSTHMASGSVSHWGVDCAIWAVNQTGLFRYYLWPSYIPKNALGIKLDTDFMSVLVPGLKTHYDRNWDLVVTISPFALPTITFESGYVYLVGPINFSFNRCEPKNRKRTRWTKREFVFNFIADVHANGHMWIEHNPSRLETNVSLLGASNVRQGDSMAGPVDLHYASQLLQVLRGPGEDALNDVTLKNGIPLSSNSSFSLDNVELNISKGGAFFFSDIAVRFGNELQQLLNRQLSRS